MNNSYKKRMKITYCVLSILLMLFCLMLLFGWTAQVFAADEEFPWNIFYPAITGGKKAVPTDGVWRLIASSAFNNNWPPMIWAAADEEAFASVGSYQLFHYDGTRWTPVERFTNSSIQHIWGFNSNDVYAVADGVYHYDGSSWVLMPGSPSANVWRIWGTGPDDLFVSGNGEVYHYDGSTWMTTVIPGAYTLWEIWGSAGDDVFVVGNRGKIYHYNGTEWSAMNSGTTYNFREVWGTASNNVYAIHSTSVLHYDGTRWSPIDINVDLDHFSNPLYSIWGSAADNIYLSTKNALLFYNGTEWRSISAVGAGDICGSTGKVFVAGGGEIGVYESNAYKTHFFNAGSGFYTVAGSAENNVFLGGYNSYALLYNGEEWQILQFPYQEIFTFAWVIDKSNILAGNEWKFKYYNGVSWIMYRGYNVSFLDAWAQSAEKGFVVGYPGRIYQFNSASGLTEMDTPTSETLNGVWGSATDNVYAVGYRGTILHYDGSGWLEVKNPALNSLNAVWGNGPNDIYAVGKSGTIVHYNGTDWSVMVAGQFSMEFKDIWGFAHDNIYLAGRDGLVHYDGSGWSVLDTGYNLDIEGIWGSGPENIYLVDNQGNVYRYSK
jgi:hypothetical protein